MHIRLLELLRRLPAGDLANLSLFIQSPFFNRSEKVAALFQYLMAYAPDFDADKLRPEDASAAIWGAGKPFDKAALNRLGSQLFKLAEQFLAHSALSDDPHRQALYQLKQYDHLALESHLSAVVQRLQSPEQPGEASLNWLSVQLEMELILADQQHRNDDRTGSANLQALNDSLDLYFATFKLKLLNAMLSRGAVSKTNYRMSWKEAVLEALQQSPEWRSNPLTELQYLMMQVLEQPGSKPAFTALHEWLLQQRQALPATDLRDGFACLQNAAKRVWPVQEYYLQLFDLYKDQYEAGILYENGKLHHAIFRNVVNAALLCGHSDWAAQFIQDQRRRILPEAYNDAAYFQNLALLYFHQGQFGKAQDSLRQSRPVDVYYKLADRSLLARIYYELRESEALDNLLNSFSKFVFDQQKKIAAPKISSYRLFINSLRQWHQLLHSNPALYQNWLRHHPAATAEQAQAIGVFLDEVAASPVFYGQKWLMEKADELLQRA